MELPPAKEAATQERTVRRMTLDVYTVEPSITEIRTPL